MKTIHNLIFEVAPWEYDLGDGFIRFRVGTVTGLFRCTVDEYQILALVNHEKHNGHLEDVFQWFMASCKRNKKQLAILEIWNDHFLKHLKEKKGFIGTRKKVVHR